MNTLPDLREAQQLHRLRGLRVQRARAGVAQADAEVAKAVAVVRERQLKIDARRREIDALCHAIVHALAPGLPRWSRIVSAQRERLDDRLERDEYALIGEERELEQTQEKAQQARAELTRALAREDAVRGLVQETRQAGARAREQRAELELEDQPVVR